jgi:hypothetical protein
MSNKLDIPTELEIPTLNDENNVYQTIENSFTLKVMGIANIALENKIKESLVTLGWSTPEQTKELNKTITILREIILREG